MTDKASLGRLKQELRQNPERLRNASIQFQVRVPRRAEAENTPAMPAARLDARIASRSVGFLRRRFSHCSTAENSPWMSTLGGCLSPERRQLGPSPQLMHFNVALDRFGRFSVCSGWR